MVCIKYFWPSYLKLTLGCPLDCRLLFVPASGTSTNLYFLSFDKFYANSDFISIIFDLYGVQNVFHFRFRALQIQSAFCRSC